VKLRAPTWAFFVPGAVAGAAMPSLGTMVRARWSVLLAGSPRLHAAFSFGGFAGAGAGLGLAFIALTITITFVLQRVREVTISRTDFIRQGIVAPFLPFLPVWVWILCRVWIGGFAQATGTFAPLPAAGMSLLTIVLVSWSMVAARRLDA